MFIHALIRGTCARGKEPSAGQTARRTRELGLPDLLIGDDLGTACGGVSQEMASQIGFIEFN